MYVLSQILGSTLACLTLKVLFNHQNNILPTLTQYSTPTTDLEAFLWEFIITFILMLTINGAATDDRSVCFLFLSSASLNLVLFGMLKVLTLILKRLTQSKELAGVAIGVTLMFNVIIAG